MRRIALIGCSQSKLGKNCPKTKFSAKDIYLGRNYKKAREQGIKYFNCEDNFYILSGKYGLLAGDTKISYYDTYLGNFSVKEKKVWANMVIEQLKQNFDLTNTEFIIFAGDSYSKYIKNYLNCTILKFKGRNITFEIKEQLDNGNKEMRKSNFIRAYKLRNKDELNKIPNDNPGYYKWWAPNDTLQKILNKLNIQFEDIKEYLEEKDGYYCIYIGVAIKESLRDRLNWHINQINNPTNVRYGTLSTLRQTIASLVGKNMLDTNATNNFIDNLLVEYYLSNKPIKSQEAKDEIHKIEYDMLNCNTLYILNIQDNHHKSSPKKKLTELRRVAKQI